MSLIGLKAKNRSAKSCDKHTGLVQGDRQIIAGRSNVSEVRSHCLEIELHMTFEHFNALIGSVEL